MWRQLPCCACLCQVLVEGFAYKLASTIGSQDFDRFAVLLGDCPGLIGLVGCKSLVLCSQQEGGRVLSHVIGEGDKVPSTLARGDRGWSPHIGMYLISKVLSRWTDSNFGN